MGDLEEAKRLLGEAYEHAEVDRTIDCITDALSVLENMEEGEADVVYISSVGREGRARSLIGTALFNMDNPTNMEKARWCLRQAHGELTPAEEPEKEEE